MRHLALANKVKTKPHVLSWSEIRSCVRRCTGRRMSVRSAKSGASRSMHREKKFICLRDRKVFVGLTLRIAASGSSNSGRVLGCIAQAEQVAAMRIRGCRRMAEGLGLGSTRSSVRNWGTLRMPPGCSSQDVDHSCSSCQRCHRCLRRICRPDWVQHCSGAERMGHSRGHRSFRRHFRQNFLRDFRRNYCSEARFQWR